MREVCFLRFGMAMDSDIVWLFRKDGTRDKGCCVLPEVRRCVL